MAGRWLLYAASMVALALAATLALAGFLLVGLFLGAVIVLAAKSAVAPHERAAAAAELRRECNRLPFCDCG